MIFMNRYDKFQPLWAIDETELDVFDLSIDGWNSEIHIVSREMIGKYRYVAVNNRLYAITSYAQDVTGTDMTARDVLGKLTEDINLKPGTYNLMQLVTLANESVQVTTNGNKLPSIEIEENDNMTARDAIDSLLAGANVVSIVETVFNTHGFNGAMDVYYARIELFSITWNSYAVADKAIAMLEYGNKTDTNPQYDTSRRIVQVIGSIDAKSTLKSWRTRISTADYEALILYIDGDENAINDDQASSILMRAMEFKRGPFETVRGSAEIINSKGIDDGLRFKLDDINFSDYNSTRTRIINNVLSQYNGYTVGDLAVLPEPRAQFIIGVNGEELYVPYSYTINCKTFIINNADFVLANTLEEFADE
ncbi:hypothetical protein IW492_05930 [Enterococcus sp. BWB1-3]|uniref:hypothetical protein n=1 Tax=Enterococcus sp. BWB1-3 TaxID=2787713 RepID=UPI0019246D38|nr:hypothetical protein [Enterococcus sp. BWB1-3]MBL1228771.1 hypothetical protein [Enterococcus sp. BWB1-3]